MFEQKSNQSPASQGPLTTVEPPANLPTAGQSSGSKEPEDILADVDIGESSFQGPSQPADLTPLPPSVPAAAKAEAQAPFFKRYQKVLVVVVIVVVGAAVLGAAGWYGYNQFFGPQAEPSVETNQNDLNTGQVPTANQEPEITNPDLTNQPSPDQAIVNNNAMPPTPIDTDRDGLSDQEEALYGTAIDQVDTDADNLTDRDEVKVFKTDPNNADTDGDTYIDGDEVRAGYDPKGPGRLLEIE